MPSDKRVHIEDLVFDPLRQAEIHTVITQVVSHPGRQSFVYLKPYVEFFKPGRPYEVTRLLQRADLVVADGISVQWAASYLDDAQPGIGHWLWSLVVGMRRGPWLTRVIPERGAGVDTTQALLALAEKKKWSVGVLGGTAAASADIQLALKKRYPKLSQLHVWPGYFTEAEERGVVQDITTARLDILFVAMGYPRQEAFISRHRHGLATVLIGEGGTFDYDQMGGHIGRAPNAWRKAGLEWLYRLLRQPQRLLRQLEIPRFMWRIYKLNTRTARG